jgi:hypothetical protein
MATAAAHRGTPLLVRGSRCLCTHLPFACEPPRFPRVSSSILLAKYQEYQPEEHRLCCHPVEPCVSIRPLFTQSLLGCLRRARTILCGDREGGGVRGACGPQDRGCCAWGECCESSLTSAPKTASFDLLLFPSFAEVWLAYEIFQGISLRRCVKSPRRWHHIEAGRKRLPKLAGQIESRGSKKHDPLLTSVEVQIAG